jgi:protein tyrosine/serine phosphatase
VSSPPATTTDAPRPRFATRALVAALLVGVAGAAAWFLLTRPPFYHWVEVVPGKVYRSGTLEEDLGPAIDRFHLKTVVNLRSEGERATGGWYASERKVTAEKGVTLVDVPIEPGMPPSPEQVAQLLQVFDDPARAPVLLHCEHGVTRSAGVEALYRREYLGESAEQALEHVRNLKPDLETKYPKIAEFIRAYEPRRSTTPRAGSSGKTQ